MSRKFLGAVLMSPVLGLSAITAPAALAAADKDGARVTAEKRQRIEHCSGYVVGEYGGENKSYVANRLKTSWSEYLTFMGDNAAGVKGDAKGLRIYAGGEVGSGYLQMLGLSGRAAQEVTLTANISREMIDVSAVMTFPNVNDLSHNKIDVSAYRHSVKEGAAELAAETLAAKKTVVETVEAMTKTFRDCVNAPVAPKWKRSFQYYTPTKF